MIALFKCMLPEASCALTGANRMLQEHRRYGDIPKAVIAECLLALTLAHSLLDAVNAREERLIQTSASLPDRRLRSCLCEKSF